jgi:hypothetical protein
VRGLPRPQPPPLGLDPRERPPRQVARDRRQLLAEPIQPVAACACEPGEGVEVLGEVGQRLREHIDSYGLRPPASPFFDERPPLRYRVRAGEEMDFSKLERGEIVAVLGGALLAVSVFLSWYKLGNQFATLNGHRGAGKQLSAWEALTVTRILLLLAAIAPLILAWIIVRQHALSWPRGELTAVVAITAITLIVVRGLIIKPGSPSGEVSLDYGWFVSLVAGIVILVGAVIHRSQFDTVRKPPGVL